MASITASPSSISQEVINASAWSNDTNVFASDDSRTSCAMQAGGVSDALIPVNYNLSGLPDDATLNGFEMPIEWSNDTWGFGQATIYLELWHNGAVIGTGTSAGANYATSDAIATLGGASSMFGAAPTVADVKDGTFGYRVFFEDALGFDSFNLFVDHLPLTVHYTEAGGGSSGGAANLLTLGAG
jgi:hypothetical protein